MNALVLLQKQEHQLFLQLKSNTLRGIPPETLHYLRDYFKENLTACLGRVHTQTTQGS